jgi:hypothetical protein
VAAWLLVALATGPSPVAPQVQAAGPAVQDVPVPPGVAAGLFQSPLTGPDVFAPGTCPTGKASGENVGEGFKLTVRGRCVSESSSVNLPVSARGITLWDGDIALDFKVVVGFPRAGVNLYVRNQDGRLMAAYVNLAAGELSLFRRREGVNMTVASRRDLRELADFRDWNRLALRITGGEIWLLINDEPLLYSADVIDQSGGIGIGVVREGNVDDDGEVAVVFRDLTVSSLGAPEP